MAKKKTVKKVAKKKVAAKKIDIVDNGPNRSPTIKRERPAGRTKNQSAAKKATQELKRKERAGGKHLRFPNESKPFDFELLERLVFYQCTQSECAGMMGVSVDRLNKELTEALGLTFNDYFTEKSVGGIGSLRRAQFQLAVDGKSVPLLIWLGKQLLGQSEKGEINLNTSSREETREVIKGLVSEYSALPGRRRK